MFNEDDVFEYNIPEDDYDTFDHFFDENYYGKEV